MTVWSWIGAVAFSPVAMATGVPRLLVTEAAVSANGARSTAISGEETSAQCNRFRLEPRDIRAFFAAAGRVDSRAYNHDLDMSRCYAAGTVRFANGWQGRWLIDQARRGSLRLTNGRQAYFYCVDCTSTSFYPLDDEDRENGRALIRASRLR